MLIVWMMASIFCCVHLTHAQEYRIEAPRLALKWSPLHHIYFYPSFQVALEHRFLKKMTLQYDLGFIIDYPGSDSEDYIDKRGFRGIAELRYYIPSPPKIPFYIAGEFYYSRIAFDRSQVMGYDCNSGNCDYFEYVTYKVEHHHQGVGIKWGLLLFPGWNRNRSMFFDINAGMAIRSISYKDIDKPIAPGREFFDNDASTIFSPDEDDRIMPRVILGIRLGYKIL